MEGFALYPIQAEINGQTWYLEVDGETEQIAIDKGRRKLASIASTPTSHVLNARVEEIEEG